VPPRYRLYPGWFGDYGKVSGRWLLAALDAGELAPGGRVLDIGCGPGRLAARLTRQLDGGSYEGFDIVPRNIHWCQRKISARHPSFRFQLADIRNAQYNPTGSQEARAYSFPYPDREFDLALAASVFTHMRPGEIERYVCEAARVLKPGGRLLASFFMLNEDAELQLADSRGPALGEEQRDGGVPYRSGDPETPEHKIVVFERDVRQMYAGAGLAIESVRYGKWCGRRTAYLGYGQDLVVARRR
jgi:SAM-dependent methyltransferase